MSEEELRERIVYLENRLDFLAERFNDLVDELNSRPRPEGHGPLTRMDY